LKKKLELEKSLTMIRLRLKHAVAILVPLFLSEANAQEFKSRRDDNLKSRGFLEGVHYAPKHEQQENLAVPPDKARRLALQEEEGRLPEEDHLEFRPALSITNFPSKHLVVDVVSIGSKTRSDYLTAQAETWASHVSIRYFWGFTELQDFDGDCTSMTTEELEDHVHTCQSSFSSQPKINKYVAKYYGIVEMGRERRRDIGWICAQRRIGRALGWIHSKYHDEGAGIPDLLIIADDDTFLDMTKVQTYMKTNMEHNKGEPLARAGCLFGKRGGTPWPIPYGGFGTFLNKEAVQQLMKPIYCDDREIERGSLFEATCSNLEENRIGERGVFQEGMSALELFNKYSFLPDYCMHSDWLLGYMMKYYLYHQRPSITGPSEAIELLGMKNYPSCGNFTASAAIRMCTLNSAACHNQTPKDMEAMAFSSYVRTPTSYRTPPLLIETDFDAKLIDEKKEEQQKSEEGKLSLPNILLIGAQKAGTSSISNWLFRQGVCQAERLGEEPTYFTKEQHFFDHYDRYKQGIEFYAKHFDHCTDDDSAEFILDATPNYLKFPKEVYELYSQVPGDLISKLKLIVILREPVSRELSLYNHKKAQYLRTPSKESWFGDIAFANNETVMSFDHYSETKLKMELLDDSRTSVGYYVDHLKRWTSYFNREQLLVLSYNELQENPELLQWRIQKFLGSQFSGNFRQVNTKVTSDKERVVSPLTRKVLEPFFQEKTHELYQFLESNPGPSMEQRPFPHFKVHKKFAYVTVLGCNPIITQNKVYLDAVRVLIASLKEKSTEADIIVLMMYEDIEVETLLREENAIVKHIDPLQQSRRIDYFEPWFVDIALAKLRAFQLTEYERIQVLDADIGIEEGKNLDDLFFYAPTVHLVAEGLGNDSPLRAGWVMIKPSNNDFEKLQSIVKGGHFNEDLGWDYLALPVEYPGWNPITKKPKGWGFYGSQLEQGKVLVTYFLFSWL